MRLSLRSARLAGLGLAAVGLLTIAVTPTFSKEKAAGGGMSIEDIMKKGFKGKPSLAKRVAEGNGSKADVDTLVELSKALAATKPPKGDAASWTDKTSALLKAAEGVQKGDKSANAALDKAINCKSCHNAHKED